MEILHGAPALSEFRIKKLLSSFAEKGLKISSIYAEYVHFAYVRETLNDSEKEVLADEGENKVALKLTKYDYCKMTPYINKTEKSLIFEKNRDNPTSDTYLAVPREIQNEAGITRKINTIKSAS